MNSQQPASSIQHGGDHYTKMVIQPVRMSLANAYDGACHSILKYVSRHASKGGAQDLMKAEHICMIRAEELTRYPDSQIFGRTVIEPETYCRANKIGGITEDIIHANHQWMTRGTLGFQQSYWSVTTHNDVAETLAGLIKTLRINTYGEET